MVRRSLTGAVLALLIFSSAASAHFPQTATVEVPADGGTGMIETSPLPPATTQATVTVTPSTGTSFDQMALVFAPLGYGKRVLICVAFTQILLGNDEYSFDVTGNTLAQLFLAACIEQAFSQPVVKHSANLATVRCAASSTSLAIRVTRTGGRYHLHAHGKSRSLKPSGLAMSCKRVGRGLRLTLRSRNRRVRLPALVGSEFALGFINRGARPVGVRASFAVR